MSSSTQATGRIIEDRDSYYYDLTPGHRCAGVPVGALVEVAPPGFVGRPVWRGRLVSHMHSADGTFRRVSIVECTDPADFAVYRRVGHATMVEIEHVRVVEPPADQPTAQQPTLFDEAGGAR